MQQTPIRHSENFLRQRKMLLILPVIMIPMLALAFYGLGGGKEDANPSDKRFSGTGLNTMLPAARFNPKEKAINKLGLYKKADLAIAKLKERMKQDPYYPKTSLARDSGFSRPSSLRPLVAADSQANKVLQRLEQLRQVMNLSGKQTVPLPIPPLVVPERVFHEVKPKDTIPVDPQLERLSGMLDKIYRIQHPEEPVLGDTVKSRSHDDGLAMTIPVKSPTVNTLSAEPENVDSDESDGFMDIDNSSGIDSVKSNLIACVIDPEQELIAGTTVGLRLIQEADIAGHHIQKNSLIWGKISVSGERFLVQVSSVRFQSTALPVNMEVYDQDGLAGIRIPGSISRDVSKESADEVTNSLGLTSLNPGFGAQAANAGLQVGKTLISRKVHLVRGAVPAGYQLFLKNNKSKN